MKDVSRDATRLPKDVSRSQSSRWQKLAAIPRLAAAAKLWAERRAALPAPSGVCSECGEAIVDGRRGRLVCSRRCKDARYRRLHPEAYAEKRRRKDARRRARLRGKS